VYGDNHPSLPNFWCPPRIPGHLPQTSQQKNLGSRLSISGLISSNVWTAGTSAAQKRFFSFPRCTLCIPVGVIVIAVLKNLEILSPAIKENNCRSLNPLLRIFSYWNIYYCDSFVTSSYTLSVLLTLLIFSNSHIYISYQQKC